MTIDGVVVRSLAKTEDSRGSFTEIFYDTWKLPVQPRQWSVVHSRRGTLRGMYVHRRHDEYITLLSGRCHVGLFDLRRGSRTEYQSMLIELGANAPACVAFPRGILHGWYFAEDSVHLQAGSETFAEYGQDDNQGCSWSDPELNIAWPDTPVLVSEGARNFSSLSALKERFFPLRARVPSSA
jgi:dTDP-4-dehydrorhamnose 3,5-epimerase